MEELSDFSDTQGRGFSACVMRRNAEDVVSNKQNERVSEVYVV